MPNRRCVIGLTLARGCACSRPQRRSLPRPQPAARPVPRRPEARRAAWRLHLAGLRAGRAGRRRERPFPSLPRSRTSSCRRPTASPTRPSAGHARRCARNSPPIAEICPMLKLEQIGGCTCSSRSCRRARAWRPTAPLRTTTTGWDESTASWSGLSAYKRVCAKASARVSYWSCQATPTNRAQSGAARRCPRS